MTAAASLNEQQGALLAPVPITDRLNTAGGLVLLEDLEWPIFDPKRVTTMANYAGEIGTRMAEKPREDPVTDSALQLYRDDFKQAEPGNLKRGLIFPHTGKRKLPKKSVIKVTGGYCDLSRNQYPGILPYDTGVSVSEDVYEEIVKSAGYFANQIDNKTQRANEDEPIVEARADLSGESVVYAFVNKHQLLEGRDQALEYEHDMLAEVNRSAVEVNPYHAVAVLEPLRLRGLASILEMTRIACKGLGYGTNQTRNTINAAVSNIHRAPEARQRRKWIAEYSFMAIRYNEAVRGKVNQSIHACIEGIAGHREHLINNLYREYTDD